LILGKNGSGKSSLLHAILWVLSDKYGSHFPKSQKRALLNSIAQQ